MTIKTGQKLPHLALPLVGGGQCVLGDPAPPGSSVLVFYRGLHCRRCNPYLNEWQKLLPEFHKRGAEVTAVSGDTAERAAESVERWGIGRLRVAYGFPIERAPEWGLYVTERGKPEDPPLFTEPALFIVGPDGRLDHAIIATAQRLRPHPEDVLAHVQDRLDEAASAVSAG